MVRQICMVYSSNVTRYDWVTNEYLMSRIMTNEEIEIHSEIEIDVTDKYQMKYFGPAITINDDGEQPDAYIFFSDDPNLDNFISLLDLTDHDYYLF
jgi:hypothetical protein